MDKNAKIYVTGHEGMVGSALMRRLAGGGYSRLLARTRPELDLLDQTRVHDFLMHERPDYVFIAAGRVGGIGDNSAHGAEFIYQNLLIAANLVHGAHLAGVPRLMFLGSSCIYPRLSEQPIREAALLSGALEPTNEPYAIAKIAGVKLCQSYSLQYGRQYASVMPTNLYGANDNYDLASGHVLPALIRKAHEAKCARAGELVVWGSGTPRREFLYVDDLADACVFLMEKRWAGSLINIGAGVDLTIRELAETVARVVGFEGRLVYDTSKPDGMPRKLLDVSGLAQLGWRATVELEDGIQRAYAAFLKRPQLDLPSQIAGGSV